MGGWDVRWEGVVAAWDTRPTSTHPPQLSAITHSCTPQAISILNPLIHLILSPGQCGCPPRLLRLPRPRPPPRPRTQHALIQHIAIAGRGGGALAGATAEDEQRRASAGLVCGAAKGMGSVAWAQEITTSSLDVR